MSRHNMWQRPLLKNRLEALHKPSIGILSGRNAPGYWTNDTFWRDRWMVFAENSPMLFLWISVDHYPFFERGSLPLWYDDCEVTMIGAKKVVCLASYHLDSSPTLRLVADQ